MGRAKLTWVKRLLAATVLLGALAFPAPVPASQGAIRGVVLDTTCWGPCAYPPPPAPRYSGDGLTVRVRSAPGLALIATLHPKDGRFRVALPAGLYRVWAGVGGGCWTGEAKRVRVLDGSLGQVRLRVHNACVV